MKHFGFGLSRVVPVATFAEGGERVLMQSGGELYRRGESAAITKQACETDMEYRVNG